MGRKYGFSFSWKRATGVSGLKNKISRKIGVPLTRSGRRQKVGNVSGCLLPLLVILCLVTVVASSQTLDRPERKIVHSGDAVSQRPKRPRAKALPTPVSLSLIDAKYDKIYDLTRISTADPISPSNDVMMSFSFTYDGRTHRPNIDQVQALFIASPQAWGNTEANKLVGFLLDNTQPAKRMLVSYSSVLSEAGLLFISYSTPVSINEFREIACAKRVDVKVGIRDGELSEKDLNALRALLAAAGYTCK